MYSLKNRSVKTTDIERPGRAIQKYRYKKNAIELYERILSIDQHNADITADTGRFI
jgi:hypothetical protein